MLPVPVLQKSTTEKTGNLITEYPSARFSVEKEKNLNSYSEQKKCQIKKKTQKNQCWYSTRC